MYDNIAKVTQVIPGNAMKELDEAYSAYAKNFNLNMTDCHSDTPFTDFYAMWCKHKGYVNDSELPCN